MVTETHRSLSCQTDMTMLDLDKMETENVQINEELKLFHEKNLGYPKEEQLKEDKKLLKFYTKASQCLWRSMTLLQKASTIQSTIKFQPFTVIL